MPSEPQWRECFDIPARVEELSEARAKITALVSGLGFPSAQLFDLKVALGEALANAVRHGSCAREEPLVRVRVIAHTDRVVLEVEDSGPGFDGTLTPTDDVYASGGRGVMFMRALMDRVEFDRSALGGTVVRLTKHRAGVGS